MGQLTESVSVTARGETVASTTTSHQAVMDLTQVTNLSIRGRDPISLLKILPGVQMLPNDQETFGGSFATPVPKIQGGRGQTIYVDGINGGDGGGGGNFSGATNLDAIQEVNVQMSTYTAEYGLKGGAQVNFITKRGGSEYQGHGLYLPAVHRPQRHAVLQPRRQHRRSRSIATRRSAATSVVPFRACRC